MKQTAEEEVPSDKKKNTGKNMTSSEIKDIFSLWRGVQGFVWKNYTDKSVAVASRICNLFNNNVLPNFRQTLKSGRSISL